MAEARIYAGWTSDDQITPLSREAEWTARASASSAWLGALGRAEARRGRESREDHAVHQCAVQDGADGGPHHPRRLRRNRRRSHPGASTAGRDRGVAKDAEIRPHDLERVIEAAKAVASLPTAKNLHVLPQEFIVDDQDGIRDRSGCRACGWRRRSTSSPAPPRRGGRDPRCGARRPRVEELVLEPLASADAVLTQDEDLGLGVFFALLDIGGGTTDVAIFYEGSVRHTAVIGLGD